MKHVALLSMVVVASCTPPSATIAHGVADDRANELVTALESRGIGATMRAADDGRYDVVVDAAAAASAQETIANSFLVDANRPPWFDVERAAPTPERIAQERAIERTVLAMKNIVHAHATIVVPKEEKPWNDGDGATVTIVPRKRAHIGVVFVPIDERMTSPMDTFEITRLVESATGIPGKDVRVQMIVHRPID